MKSVRGRLNAMDKRIVRLAADAVDGRRGGSIRQRSEVLREATKWASDADQSNLVEDICRELEERGFEIR